MYMHLFTEVGSRSIDVFIAHYLKQNSHNYHVCIHVYMHRQRVPMGILGFMLCP